jgi:hypothetical protein
MLTPVRRPAKRRGRKAAGPKAHPSPAQHGIVIASFGSIITAVGDIPDSTQGDEMIRLTLAFLLVVLPRDGLAQGFDVARGPWETGWGELPEAPEVVQVAPVVRGMPVKGDSAATKEDVQSGTGPPKPPAEEPYHWKGLLLQSFAFDMLQNATRIITADQADRHLLLNKPYWSDYWASCSSSICGAGTTATASR